MFCNSIYYDIISIGIPSTRPEARRYGGLEYSSLHDAVSCINRICSHYRFSWNPTELIVLSEDNGLHMTLKISGSLRNLNKIKIAIQESQELNQKFNCRLIQ